MNELKAVDLKDKRLDNHLGQVCSQLGAYPTASIPSACGGNGEVTGAYRLFDNDKATFDAILQPHVDSTRERGGAQSAVLGRIPAARV